MTITQPDNAPGITPNVPPHVRTWLLARAPWLAALLSLAVILLTERSGWPVGVFYDDGIYLDLARSLIAGDGYRHSSLPGAPPGVHYPPLFPVWLASWSWLRSLFGPHDVVAWLKLGNALLAALAVALWGMWGAKRLLLHPAVASSLAAASMLIVPARAVTSTLFSEPLSWVLLALALLLAPFPMPNESDAGRARPWLAALIAGLLSAVRSALLPFSLAAALQHLRQRSLPVTRRVLAVSLCLAPALLFSLWTMRHGTEIPDAWRGNYGTYTAMWRQSWSTPNDLLALAARQLAGFWRIASAIWSAPGAIVAFAAAVVGLFVVWRVQQWVVVGLVGYIALILIWPIEPDRFVWGVLPLITLIAAAGVADFVRRVRRRRVAIMAVLLAIALPLGACGRWTARGYANRGWIVPQEIAARNAAPLVRWARTLPRDAVVLTGNDPLFAIATGLRAAPALTPDLGEARGRQLSTPAQRLEQSACVLRTGWLAVGDSSDQVGSALRQLLTAPSPHVSVSERIQLEGRGEAWHFTCR